MQIVIFTSEYVAGFSLGGKMNVKSGLMNNS